MGVVENVEENRRKVRERTKRSHQRRGGKIKFLHFVPYW